MKIGGEGMNTNKRKKYDKFVVVCIAGQSNAVGFDESPVNKKIAYKNLDNSRIKQLGFYGDDNLKIVDLGYCAQAMQDMRVHNRPNTATCVKNLEVTSYDATSFLLIS